MRNKIIIMVLPIMLTIGSYLFAQNSDDDSSLWYFPTEMFVKKNCEILWGCDSSYISNITKTLGHYPDSIELDSINNIQLHICAMFSNSTYSSFLQELEEPILCNGYHTVVFRQTWFQNELKGNYSPYSIRIEKDEDDKYFACFSYRLWDKKYQNYSIHHDTILFNEENWIEFIHHIDEYDFWNKPSVLDTTAIVFGGSTCIIEGEKNGNYHAVIRNISLDTGICTVQDFLWKLTRVKKKIPGYKRNLFSRITKF